MSMSVKLGLQFVTIMLLMHIFTPTTFCFGGSARRKLSSGIPGFISIDCGAAENYYDDKTGIFYESDSRYIDTGVNMEIAPSIFLASGVDPHLASLINLRYFPQGVKNCYTLQVSTDQQGSSNNQYLIRASFMYGNYDGKSEGSKFDLYLGANLWDTIQLKNSSDATVSEIIHVPDTQQNMIQVCLVNTGSGVPFISALETRLLDNSIYQIAAGSGPLQLIMMRRYDFGDSTEIVRYKDDVFDRLWFPRIFANCVPINTVQTIDIQNGSDPYKPPAEVLRTALESQNVTTPIKFYWVPPNPNADYYVYFHFAEIQELQGGQQRQLGISVNGDQHRFPRPILLDYLKPVTITPTSPIRGDRFDFSVYAIQGSDHPPIINAMELFMVKEFPLSPTNPGDVGAIMDIKQTYKLTKDWQGDPCVPGKYMWEGLNCSNDIVPRIISLNLSSSRLAGKIAPSLFNLTSVESLDLSYNGLTGPVPDFLAQLPALRILNLTGNKLTGCVPKALVEKSEAGTLSLRLDQSPDHCLITPNERKKFKVPVLVAIAVLVLLMVTLLGVLICCYIKRRRLGGLKIEEGLDFKEEEEVLELKNEEGLGESEHKRIGSVSLKPKKQLYTYSEVKRFTNNFANSNRIGEGGFGIVYKGILDGKAVAVKMHSQNSRQGIKEIQSEVEVLMKIYHKNLVTLVGYCDENPEMGLIYEYMENGSLKKHLSATNSNVLLTWRKRLQIALDTARGLNYLHNDCDTPIIHRDLKPENILLDENWKAKIADFGLSREFPTDMSHILTDPAGTVGYYDPEIQMSGRFTKRTDVYSFGIILLELITGKPVIIRSPIPNEPGINIAQWMKKVYASGDISKYVDPKLAGNFHINSVSLAAETAVKCTRPTSEGRPDICDVVKELEACLALEMAPRRTRGMEIETNTSFKSAITHISQIKVDHHTI